jgi:hypothetical protein
MPGSRLIRREITILAKAESSTTKTLVRLPI